MNLNKKLQIELNFLHTTVYDITEAFPLLPQNLRLVPRFPANRTHSLAIRFSLSYIYFIHAVSYITFETSEKD
jgi:hypothetical protein